MQYCAGWRVAVDFGAEELRLLAEIGFLGIGRGRCAVAAAMVALLGLTGALLSVWL